MIDKKLQNNNENMYIITRDIKLNNSTDTAIITAYVKIFKQKYNELFSSQNNLDDT